MFCVECGKESGDALVGGLCHDCFLRKNEFARLPEHVDLEVCVHCRARRRGEIWVDGGDDVEAAVEAAVREAVIVDSRARGVSIAVTLVAEDPKNFTVKARVAGDAEGVAFDETREARSRVKGATCTRCSRIQGGYYEGTVQVRAAKRSMSQEELHAARAIASRVIDKIVSEGDRNAFVLKDLEIEGGLDIVAGTTNSGRMIARAIADRLGGIMKEHAKVAGKKDGNDIWRITFAIRLPGYQRGDLVIRGEEPFVVSSIGPKNVTLRSQRTGRPTTIERDDLERLPLLKREEARSAIIVTRSANEMQILNPWTYETVTVLAPADAASLGETVDVVTWQGELIPLPANAPTIADA